MEFASSVFASVSLYVGGVNATTKASCVVPARIALPFRGGTVSVPMSGTCTISIEVHGHIETIHVDAYDMGPVHFDAYDVIKVGAAPEIDVLVTCRHDLRISLSTLIAALIASHGPVAVLAAGNELKESLADRLGDEVVRIATNAGPMIPTGGFPFIDLLTQSVKDGLRTAIDAGVTNDLATLRESVRTAVRACFSQFVPELWAYTSRAISEVRQDAERCAEVLLAAGRSAEDVLGAFMQSLVSAVRQGRSVSEEGPWLFAAIWSRDRRAASMVLAQLLAECVERWPERRSDAERLVRAALQTADAGDGPATDLRRTLVEMLSQSVGERISRPHGMSAIADLIVMIGVRYDRDWRTAGMLFGAASAMLASSASALPMLLGAMWSANTLDLDGFLAFLRGVGRDSGIIAVCVTMSDQWPRVAGAFGDAAAQIRGVVDAVAAWSRSGADRATAVLPRLSASFGVLPSLQRQLSEDGVLTGIAECLHAMRSDDASSLLRSLRQRAAREASDLVTTLRTAVSGGVLARANDMFVASADMLARALGSDAGIGPQTAITLIDRARDLAGDIASAAFGGWDHPRPFSVSMSTGKTDSALDQAILDLVRRVSSSLADQMNAAVAVTTLSGWPGRVTVGRPTPGAPMSPIPEVRLPILIPRGPLPGSLRVSHLSDIEILDMRYRMPYGAGRNYRVVDGDSNGRVDGAEVDAIRRAIAVGGVVGALDADGDGALTAADLQLAIDQQSLYRNGLMFRRTSTLCAFEMDLGLAGGAAVAVASLEDESLPDQLERRGIVVVHQVRLLELERIITRSTAVDWTLAKLFPLKLHTEHRFCVDTLVFPASDGRLIPAVPSPWAQSDLVVTAGTSGSVFQLHLHQPAPSLLTRTLRARLNLHMRAGITGAYFGVGAEEGLGAAARGAGYLHLGLESARPLAESVESWTAVPELSAGRLTVGLPQRAGEIVKLLRAMSRAIGPWEDVLLGWTDRRRDVRAVLAVLEETLLLGFEPAPTWDNLIDEVASWAPEEDAQSDEVRNVIRSTIMGAASELGMISSDAVIAPGSLLDRIRVAIAGMRGPRRGGLRLLQAAESVLAGRRSRFVVSFEQVVPSYDNPPRIKVGDVLPNTRVRFAGKVFSALGTVFMPSGTGAQPVFPVQCPLRFVKPAKLSLAPFCGAPHEHVDIASGVRGVTLGSRILSDDAGDLWAFVGLDSGEFGWLPLPNDLATQARAGVLRQSAPGSGPVELYAPPITVVDSGPDRAIARSVLKGPDGPWKEDLLRLREHFLNWMKFSIFQQPPFDLSDDLVRPVLAAMTGAQKRAFWDQFTSDMRCVCYTATAGRMLVESVFVPLILGQPRASLAGLVNFAASTASGFDPARALAAVEIAVPALIDIARAGIPMLVDVLKPVLEPIVDAATDAAFWKMDEARVRMMRSRDPIERDLAATYWAQRASGIGPDIQGEPRKEPANDGVKVLWSASSPRSGKSQADAGKGPNGIGTSTAINGDRISICWSAEGAAGGGAGGESGMSAAAEGTGGLKLSAMYPTFPVDMMKDPYAIGVFLRLGVRTLHHQLRIAAFYADNPEKVRGVVRPLSFENLEFHVLGFIATYCAMRELALEHPAWIAKSLEEIQFKLELEVNASVLGAIAGGLDLNETVTAEVHISLAEIVWPLTAFLSADQRIAEGAAALVDRIVPRLRVSVQDRTRVRILVATSSLEVESVGVDFTGELAIPQGSILRDGMQFVADVVAKIIRMIEGAILPGQLGLPWSAIDSVLTTIDTKIGSILLDEGHDTGRLDWLSADPAITGTIAEWMGRTGTPADQTLATIVRAFREPLPVRLIPFPSGRVLDVVPHSGRFWASVRLSAADKQEVERRGFVAPVQSNAPMEAMTVAIPLPTAPDELRWHRAKVGGVFVQGIIAGFQDPSDAEQLANRRDPAWLGAASSEAPHTWQMLGRHWAWVEAALVDELVARKCTLPLISLQGGALILTFDAVPVGAVMAAAVPMLRGISPSGRTQLWDVVLTTSASSADCAYLLSKFM